VGVYGGVEPTWASQTNTGRTHIATKGVVQSGLVLNLDAGVSSSYPGSGTTWTDLSGNGNTGTLVNGVGYNSGNGGSLSFDATDDYVELNDSNSLDLTTALTLSLWFNRGDILALAAGDQHNLFVKGNSIAPGGDQVNYAMTLFGPTGGGRYAWVHPTTGGANISPPSQIFFANQWYNIAITHVSGSTPIPYLNGVIQTNWTATNPSNALVANSFKGTICGDAERSLGARAATFNGRMSNVLAYNRALTAAEISQNYNATKSRFGL
jgi:hypothetical protein